MKIILDKEFSDYIVDIANQLEIFDKLIQRQNQGKYIFPPGTINNITSEIKLSLKSNYLSDLGKILLREGGYAHLTNMPKGDRPAFFIGFCSLLGKIFDDSNEQPGPLLISEVHPNARMQGSQLRFLDFHTDYSMLDLPPRLTVLRNIQQDPTPNMGSNGICDIGKLFFVYKDSYFGKLWTKEILPFGAMNATGEEHLTNSPIIKEDESYPNKFLVRFHISRIRRGFYLTKQTPTYEQMEAVHSFLSAVREFSEKVILGEGDILIIDNHACLHSRDACSCLVSLNGSFVGRETQVIFVDI